MCFQTKKLGCKDQLDSVRSELRHPSSSSSVGESGAIAVGIRVSDSTSCVAVDRVVAIGGVGGSGLSNRRRLGASRLGVQGHLVLGHRVDTLERVDLSAVRPIRACRPESRPDRATIGHMERIQHPNRADRVVFLSGDSNRVSFVVVVDRAGVVLN